MRFPALLFLFPHLWIVLGRLLRSRYALRAFALMPWLAAGEIARIQGFLEARRQYKSSGAFERPRLEGAKA